MKETLILLYIMLREVFWVRTLTIIHLYWAIIRCKLLRKYPSCSLLKFGCFVRKCLEKSDMLHEKYCV